MTRRPASRPSTPTTPRISPSGARPRPGWAHRCSTWGPPSGGSRSRSRATATRSGPSIARREMLGADPRAALAGEARRGRRARPHRGGRAASPSPSIAAFRLIIVAMNTLQVLTEPEDRAACLRRVRDHLAEGGEFIFDVALPDVDEIRDTMGVERPSGRHREPDGSGADPLGLVRQLGSGHPDARVHDPHHAARRDGTTGETLRHHRVHLFTPAELAGLLASAGLEQIAVYGRLRRLPPRRRRRAPGPPLRGGRVSGLTVRLGHLYPDEMNIYADRGNIAVLERRLAWRGHRAGGDRDRHRRHHHPGRPRPLLPGRRPGPRSGRGGARTCALDQGRGAAGGRADGAAGLAVCGGFQLAGHGYTGIDGSRMPGIGILDLRHGRGADAPDRQPRHRGRARRRAPDRRRLREPRRPHAPRAPARARSGG